MLKTELADYSTDIAGLSQALISQRQYTLALYADLPLPYWEPANFPYLKTVNPPLWELAHIAWFAEFFCLRWRPEDIRGQRVASCLPGSDALFDSAAVAHAARWSNSYPSREACFDYMRRSLDRVLEALGRSGEGARYPFQLAAAHEDMHAEALVITLNSIGLPRPAIVPRLSPVNGVAYDIVFDGGEIVPGSSARAFRFDNEMTANVASVAPFAISSRVVTEAEFSVFRQSDDYHDDRLWSNEGASWRRSLRVESAVTAATDDVAPAMHINFFQAEAWCRWAGRRLPTELEWEFAATRSPVFAESAGRVWEWTASPFTGYPGFEPGPYKDYSVPWFGNHQVLRGGSFATHPRLRYPQYRNFYTPDRGDMFCGFRTCATAF